MSTHIATAPEGLHLSPSPKIAILTSRFNPDVTGGLKKGALAWLAEHDIDEVDLYDAPGAFELPLMAQRLARMGKYEGVICLGCVIKGDTAHFEFISTGATLGIMKAQLETETPISFGILTTYSDEQAVVRSRDDVHNKGREAAAACIETVSFLRSTQ